MQCKIRQATVGDATGLQQCMAAAYAAYQERMDGGRLPPMDLDYENEIRNYPTWIAEKDGRIVGGVTMLFEGDHASIANVAVDPEMQGQGLGGTLLEFAEATAKSKHYSEICLATHVLLTENISLYSHLGWVEYDRDDIRAYMRKSIE